MKIVTGQRYSGLTTSERGNADFFVMKKNGGCSVGGLFEGRMYPFGGVLSNEHSLKLILFLSG